MKRSSTLFNAVGLCALASALVACGGGDAAAPAGGGGGGGGGVAGTLTVTAASNAARNGAYAPSGAVFASGADSGFNAQTADTNFELEVVWGPTATIKRAHVWFNNGGTLRFFGCDGGKTIACTGVAYEPLSKQITFTNVAWTQVNADLVGSGTDSPVAAGETLTINGTIDAK